MRSTSSVSLVDNIKVGSARNEIDRRPVLNTWRRPIPFNGWDTQAIVFVNGRLKDLSVWRQQEKRLEKVRNRSFSTPTSQIIGKKRMFFMYYYVKLKMYLSGLKTAQGSGFTWEEGQRTYTTGAWFLPSSYVVDRLSVRICTGKFWTIGSLSGMGIRSSANDNLYVPNCWFYF